MDGLSTSTTCVDAGRSRHGRSSYWKEFVAWHSISNFYYLVSATRARPGTLQFVAKITRLLDVVPTTREHLRRALTLARVALRSMR